MSNRTDTERLDELQKLLGKYTGKVTCRWSENNRGWRLHESSLKDSADNVRDAIDSFLDTNIPTIV